MKFRMLIVAALAVVALLGVAPTFAQDAAGQAPAQTIAELVTSGTQTGTPEFTTLLAALNAADPSVLALLSNADASVTVFAPTDAAFAAALETLGMSAADLLADQSKLTNILLYHVVPGTFEKDALVALDGSLLGTMLSNTSLNVSADDAGVRVNSANVETTDLTASNGVVHVIDAVLMSPSMEDSAPSSDAPTQNIAELVTQMAGADAPDFTTLLAAVQASDPAILSTLTGAGPYTVFAPNDTAFKALFDGLGITEADLLADPELLTTVLAYHIVPGALSADTLTTSAGTDGAQVATALAGTWVKISVVDGAVKVNDATVITPDVQVTNGVVHVIDGVLLPPNGS